MIFNRLRITMSQAGSLGGGGSGPIPTDVVETITTDNGVATASGNNINFLDSIVGVSRPNGRSVRTVASGDDMAHSLFDENSIVLNGAAFSATPEFFNTGIGDRALLAINGGSSNVAVGRDTLWNVTTGEFNTAVGSFAGQGLTTGSSNTLVGRNAGQNLGTTSNNIMVGNQGNSADSGVIRIGSSSQSSCYVAGVASVITSNSEFVTIDTATGQLGSTSSTGSGIVTINGDSGSGASGTDIGIYAAGTAGFRAGGTVVFDANGVQILLSCTDANNNTGIGLNAGISLSVAPGTYNTYLGSNAGSNQQNGSGNIGIGGFALSNSVSDNSNIGIGTTALLSLTGGTSDGNVAIGDAAAGACPSLAQNTILGASSASNISTSMTGNTILGWSALSSVVSTDPIDYNIVIGHQSGSSYNTNESNNILIGNTGTTSDNNVIRIGTTGISTKQQNKAFIAASYGVTTDSGTTSPLLISNTGQLGTLVSSIRYKDEVVDMSDKSSDILKLRPVNFVYKSDKSKRVQWGLIAEEVNEVFPELVNFDEEGKPDSVRYHDMPAILLNEIKKLRSEINEIKRIINE